MFSKSKRARIRKAAHIYKGIVKDGKTLDFYFQEVNIPPFEEIAKMTIANLEEQGFSVKNVSRLRANCIIRVFSKERIIHEKDVFWMYGSDIFLKNFCGRYLREKNAAITYNEYKIKWNFFSDEYVIFEPRYVDYFVKII